MGIADIIRENQQLIRRIAERHGARHVRIFGSVARSEAGPESDVDLLVQAGPTTSAWFPGGLVADLEEVLGCRADIVTERGLAPEFREQDRGPSCGLCLSGSPKHLGHESLPNVNTRVLHARDKRPNFGDQGAAFSQEQDAQTSQRPHPVQIGHPARPLVIQ